MKVKPKNRSCSTEFPSESCYGGVTQPAWLGFSSHLYYYHLRPKLSVWDSTIWEGSTSYQNGATPCLIQWPGWPKEATTSGLLPLSPSEIPWSNTFSPKLFILVKNTNSPGNSNLISYLWFRADKRRIQSLRARRRRQPGGWDRKFLLSDLLQAFSLGCAGVDT